MLAGLFIACVIATCFIDEDFKFGYILAGISYFLFAFYGIAKILTLFPIR